VDRKERMDAEIKKTIDGRTKEFREKIAKLAYEKVKAILTPDAEPLKGKGYPYQEEVELGENKIFFVKVGDGRDSMTVKTKAPNSREAMKKMRDEYPKKKVSLDRNQKQGQPAGAFESIEEESDSKEFQQEIDMIANMIKKGEHERLAKMLKRDQAFKKGGGWNMAQKPSKKQKDQYNKMIGDHKKKYRSLYQSYMEDVNEQEIAFSLDESVLVERLRLRNPNKLATIDIDYIGSSSDINQSQREFNIKIKKTGRQMADVTGKKGDIVKFLQGDAYAMDDEDIEELFPELLEGVRDVENMFGLRAADWRKLVKKHARHIDAFQRGRKDLPKNVEDDLLTWAMDNGEVRNDDDAEDFIDIILNASFTPTRNDIIAEENLLNELKARYDLSDMRSSKDPKVKREFKKLEKVQYGSLQYIRQYKEVEKALDDSLPAHQRKK
jgi:hypothetical protein